jgi:parallel beta-helix repeat protein
MKKSLISYLLIAIVISGLAFFSNVYFGTANGSTEFSGIISTDTTWTKANSPYTLNGRVGIANGATLTIESGVTVNLGQYNLEVNGTLIAKGTTSEKITFTCDYQNYKQYNGFILPYGNPSFTAENVIFNYTSVIAESSYSNASVNINNCRFEGNVGVGVWGSTIISNSYFTSGILTKGTSTISNNIILSGVEVSGSYTLSHNTITKLPTQGIWVINAERSSTIQTAKITDNIIYGGSTAGINLASSATIERNLIIDNQIGISVRSKDDNSIIRHNTITRNEKGIATATSSQTISNNNLGGNSKIDLSAGYTAVDAANNWWGTTDVSAIGNKIFDSIDDYNFGTVTFSPFLTVPDSQAPSDTYTPIATPKPTSPAPSISPTISQNSSATPDPSGSQNAVGLDWVQVATLVLLGVIAVLLFLLVVFLRRRSVK